MWLLVAADHAYLLPRATRVSAPARHAPRRGPTAAPRPPRAAARRPARPCGVPRAPPRRARSRWWWSGGVSAQAATWVCGAIILQQPTTTSLRLTQRQRHVRQQDAPRIFPATRTRWMRAAAIGSHVQNTGFSGGSIETMHWQGEWPGRAGVRRQGSSIKG